MNSYRSVHCANTCKTTLLPVSCESELVRWLSVNSCAWGLGPTLVFSAAAAVFLYREIERTVPVARDRPSRLLLYMESALMTSMVIGMLLLMVHLWVGCTRYLNFYLDIIIQEYPMVLLEISALGMGPGGSYKTEPMAKFLRCQQPLLHVTACWFLALCYADYVRRNYCGHFAIPYIQQWQNQVHTTTLESINKTLEKVGNFINSIGENVRRFSSEMTRYSAPREHPPGDGAPPRAWPRQDRAADP